MQQLAVYLENGQRVYFTGYSKRSSFKEPSRNNFDRVFALCRVDNFAKTLLYVDVPRYYTWNKKAWNRRKQGTDVAGYPGVKKAHELGR